MIINLVKSDEKRIFIIVLQVICKMKKSCVYFHKYSEKSKQGVLKSRKKILSLNELRKNI